MAQLTLSLMILSPGLLPHMKAAAWRTGCAKCVDFHQKLTTHLYADVMRFQASVSAHPVFAAVGILRQTTPDHEEPPNDRSRVPVQDCKRIFGLAGSTGAIDRGCVETLKGLGGDVIFTEAIDSGHF